MQTKKGIRVVTSVIMVLVLTFTVVGCGKREIPEITLRFGHPFPETHLMGMVATNFAEKVNELSDGRITVQLFHAGAVVKGKEELSSLRRGIVDIGSITTLYEVGSLPEIMIDLTNIPYRVGFDQVEWILTETDFFQSLFTEIEDIHFLSIIPECSDLYLVEPIEDLMNPDLSGTTVRAPGGLFGEALKVFGADLMTMSSSEVPAALETNLVAGTATSLTTYQTTGLSKWCHHLYISWKNASPVFIIAMNEEKWNGLTPETQDIIAEASEEVAKWAMGYAPQRDEAIIEELEGDPDVHVHELTPEQIEAWQEKLAPLYEPLIEKHGSKFEEYYELLDEAMEALK